MERAPVVGFWFRTPFPELSHVRIVVVVEIRKQVTHRTFGSARCSEERPNDSVAIQGMKREAVRLTNLGATKVSSMVTTMAPQNSFCMFPGSVRTSVGQNFFENSRRSRAAEVATRRLAANMGTVKFRIVSRESDFASPFRLAVLIAVRGLLPKTNEIRPKTADRTQPLRDGLGKVFGKKGAEKHQSEECSPADYYEFHTNLRNGRAIPGRCLKSFQN